MANSYIQLHFVALLFVLASLTAPSNCLPRPYPKPSVALFVFGDSLFDPGNNNYIKTTATFRANFPPYGETFFKSPTGRFTNGRVIPDFIAEFAKLSLLPPYLQTGHHEALTKGVNFASGGAGALTETNAGSVTNLHMQFNYFRRAKQQLRLKLGTRATRRVVKNAVYLFSIGSNDYLSPLLSNNSSIFKSHTPQEYVAMVVGNITSVLMQIHKKGARKIGILNLGPLGCFPRLRLANAAAGGKEECQEQAMALVKLHNVLLSQKLQLLQKQLKGFKYSYFDFFTAYVARIQNPSKFGLKEAKSACCGSGPFRGYFSCGGRGMQKYELCHNPKDYLFFDAEHPAETANFQCAQAMWGGPPNVTGPYNIRSLFLL